MTQLLTTLAVVIGALTAGYLYRIRRLRQDPAAGESLRGLATALQKTTITVFTPVILVNTFWALNVTAGSLVFFPIIGALSHVVGGFVALAASRRLGHSRRQAGAMFTCGTFSNLASFGGLVTFMYYGEAGYALAALFKLFEPIAYFSIGFPIAKMYSEDSLPGSRLRLDWRALVRDRIVMLPLVGISAGALLNWSGLARPELLGSLIAPLVMVSTSMMLVSVGLNMRPAPLGSYRREVASIVAIKHLLLPALMAAAGTALGYHLLAGGLPWRVLVTMGSMPVAFNSLVAASLYRLDTDLANLCWIVSTGVFAAVLLPLLYLVSLL